MEIRNIAIIAHVDHGKTTIIDILLKKTGMVEEGVTMDSNTLEQERGITIYSKNTSLFYKGTKINIVDTPGHADFGSEVERVLRAIDSVVLVVDAKEGPMPQTRFVLKKSLELGLKPIVVINKIDKVGADPKKTLDLVLELFIELGATEEQLNFKTVYAIGREGKAKMNMTDSWSDIALLLDVVLENVPNASDPAVAPLKGARPTEQSFGQGTTAKFNGFAAQIFNLAYDNFLGRLAIARVYSGKLKVGENIFVKKPDGETRSARINKIFTFEGNKRKEVEEVFAGDIVMFAGVSDVYIGETFCNPETEPMPALLIDEPTISLNFFVNDSPFAGREGKFLTTRQLRERLEKEIEVNVGLRVDFSPIDHFIIYGRGELHVAILLENMRREGYEMQVSQPKVIFKEENGQKLEPFEELVIDVPEEFAGVVIEKVGDRRGILSNMETKHSQNRLVFEIPTRGLLGYRGIFMIDTRGEGIISSRFVGWKPYAGEIKKKELGSMVSMTAGKAPSYALDNLQLRGVMYIGPGTEVYEGMVIGNVSKGEDLTVNATKGKHLTNFRDSGAEEAIVLKPAFLLSIERGLELMAGDEYLEVTPQSVRLRKKFLKEIDRVRAFRQSV